MATDKGVKANITVAIKSEITYALSIDLGPFKRSRWRSYTFGLRISLEWWQIGKIWQLPSTMKWHVGFWWAYQLWPWPKCNLDIYTVVKKQTNLQLWEWLSTSNKRKIAFALFDCKIWFCFLQNFCHSMQTSRLISIHTKNDLTVCLSSYLFVCLFDCLSACIWLCVRICICFCICLCLDMSLYFFLLSLSTMFACWSASLFNTFYFHLPNLQTLKQPFAMCICLSSFVLWRAYYIYIYNLYIYIYIIYIYIYVSLIVCLSVF